MARKIFVVVSFVYLSFYLAACTCQPKESESLDVTLRPQQTNMWCWAASGQMVMEYLGHNIAQCTQANNRFGRTDCCNTPVPGGCVNGGWPEFGKYGFESKNTTNAALSWNDLRKQISDSRYCKGRPFCFTWRWNGGGGHMMVAIGYKTVEGVNYVEMLDPWAPNVGNHSFITYDAYVSGSTYTHWDDYYDVTYTGGN
jgi:hypothetical protein